MMPYVLKVASLFLFLLASNNCNYRHVLMHSSSIFYLPECNQCNSGNTCPITCSWAHLAVASTATWLPEQLLAYLAVVPLTNK